MNLEYLDIVFYMCSFTCCCFCCCGCLFLPFSWPWGYAVRLGINLCGVLRDLVPFVLFKNVKNNHGGVLLLLKLQASKSNTPPWVFFTFLNFTCGTKSQNASHISSNCFKGLHFYMQRNWRKVIRLLLLF